MIKYFIGFALSFFVANSAHSQVKVNEIMASNSTVIADSEGDFDDWIEIYNTSGLSIDLAGIYVSDDPGEPTKWQIPSNQSASTTIAANGYLILWADGEPGEGATHLDFRLSASGEFVILTASDGITRIDSVSFGVQTTDISWGRTTDGSGNFAFQQPTPNTSNDGSTIAEKSGNPGFSLPSGFYSGLLTIGVSSDEAVIHYETGGAVPTSNSPVFSSPISFDTSTVVRAIAIEPGKQPSEVVTATYLFEESHSVPVVSFVMEPDSLFDFDKGMYVIGDSSETNGEYPFRGANFWEEFQYPVHIEYLNESGNTEFEFDAEAEIGGNFSRAFLKKSFVINNNDRFGLDRLNYPLFPENDYEEYDGFVLRAGAEERSRLLNELLRTVNLQWGHANAMQAYKPIVLYINGQYWGLYTLYERKNDDFVESRYGYEDVDMIKDFDIITDGDDANYQELLGNFNDQNLVGEAFFQYADSVLDLESFTDHWVYQVYTSHGDPNNVRYWRPQVPGGKWHYISHDFDWWRNLGTESTDGFFSSLKLFLSEEPSGFWLFGRMMENETYREIFLNRLADMLNTAFQPDYMLALIDSIDTAIDPEMPRDIARWSEGWYDIGGPTDYDMEWIRTATEWYVEDIPGYLYSEIADTLQKDTVRITLQNITEGSVRLNSIKPTLENGSWSGIYFQDTEIHLLAMPPVDYEVENWTINGVPGFEGESEVSVALDSNPVSISVAFKEAKKTIVINEINYNSRDEFDTGDWVELYNNSNVSIDLSGWTFKDNDDTHAFVLPQNTVLESNEYLVLVRDAARFTSLHGSIQNIIGDFDFGLSSSGDEVRIFNSNDELVDYVQYSPEQPWPLVANGNGPTLELSNPEDDNNDGNSWFSATDWGGTPGAENGIVYNSNENEDTPNQFNLSQNYPNPFNPTTNISFTVPQAQRVELSVYNMLGQKLSTLVNDRLGAGSHSFTFDAGNLASGVYIYRIVAGNQTETKKMVLLK